MWHGQGERPGMGPGREGEVSADWDFYQFEVCLEQSLLSTLEEAARWALKGGLVDGREVPNYLDYIFPDALAQVEPRSVTIIR